MKYIFKNHQGEKIKDIILYLNDYMKYKNGRTKYKIYIGCDSQVNRHYTIYSVVIGIHTIMDGIGRGVHIIHTREKDVKTNESRGGIFKRLWGEVERIVEIALFLQENGFNIDDIGTHVDANKDNQYASNMIYDSAMGWLRSMGFDVKGKPEAWAATYAANKYCR
jgi:predicted RNase H-related nuclease YkuK (DUF458 family)